LAWGLRRRYQTEKIGRTGMIDMRIKTLGITALLSLAASLSAASAEAKQAPDFKENSCRTFTEKAEREQGIPRHLLTAISLAETGRWSEEKQEIFAWPWTVMAKGRGLYFKSKIEAIVAVNRLKRAGITNIDVGCMQINLRYHPRAFASLNEAFDPTANVAYAAKFLKGLHGTTQSWPQAAANYHSTDPLRNVSYKNKVLSLWQGAGGGNLASLGPLASPDPAYSDPESQLSLTTLLNARFRARINAERGGNKKVRSLEEMKAWRRGRMGPNYQAETAALRHANTSRRQRQELAKGKTGFAAKRQQQLKAWRRDRAVNTFGRR
jgi:hypothetical protein